ncbi:MAG TPA: NUDIX hydrolase [Steroidobacteraceae bacterium]|nr:NUDIX hydrolase [Steroidobacteraceae bacterium]
MPPTRFIAFHEIAEDAAGMPQLSYAVMLARAADGVLLVQSRVRQVWELPGGLIDPGETPRQAAIRELVEESGCLARNTRWLGVLEVDDGRPRFGACLCCEVDAVPEHFTNAETVSLGYWTRAAAPAPLGHADEAVLRRFA